MPQKNKKNNYNNDEVENDEEIPENESSSSSESTETSDINFKPMRIIELVLITTCVALLIAIHVRYPPPTSIWNDSKKNEDKQKEKIFPDFSRLKRGIRQILVGEKIEVKRDEDDPTMINLQTVLEFNKVRSNTTTVAYFLNETIVKEEKNTSITSNNNRIQSITMTEATLESNNTTHARFHESVDNWKNQNSDKLEPKSHNVATINEWINETKCTTSKWQNINTETTWNDDIDNIREYVTKRKCNVKQKWEELLTTGHVPSSANATDIKWQNDNTKGDINDLTLRMDLNSTENSRNVTNNQVERDNPIDEEYVNKLNDYIKNQLSGVFTEYLANATSNSTWANLFPSGFVNKATSYVKGKLQDAVTKYLTGGSIDWKNVLEGELSQMLMDFAKKRLKDIIIFYIMNSILPLGIANLFLGSMLESIPSKLYDIVADYIANQISGNDTTEYPTNGTATTETKWDDIVTTQPSDVVTSSEGTTRKSTPDQIPDTYNKTCDSARCFFTEYESVSCFTCCVVIFILILIDTISEAADEATPISPMLLVCAASTSLTFILSFTTIRAFTQGFQNGLVLALGVVSAVTCAAFVVDICLVCILGY